MTSTPGNPSTTRRQSATVASADALFGGIALIRTGLLPLFLLLVAVFGTLALPFAVNRVQVIVVASSLVVLVTATAALWQTGRTAVEGTRHRFDIAMCVGLAATVPTLYLLDVCGPSAGIIVLLLLAYNIDAPTRWGVAALLVVAIPHLTIELLMTLGYISTRTLLAITFSRPVGFSAMAITAALYTASFAFARIYRRRTAKHLESLAEAGRGIAARDALLREARADLERVAAIGRRGRFTDQTLGSFVLGNILGRGGMGEIYEARHVETGEAAAIKLLRPPAGAGGSDLLRRFEREAALIRAIDSAHVVKVLEVGGMEAALPYLAMERLEGMDCTRLLKERGKLPPRLVRDLALQVGEGLFVAKKHGIVHRDIKPSNLFLTTDGSWKVLDFGIGRLTGDSGTLTGGDLIGTIGYLAPEQLTGEGELTHRTDLHALASVMYRALTGRKAFVERDPAAALDEVETRLPERPSAFTAVPPEVDSVMRIALAKRAADRFADTCELARAFARALDGEVDPSVQRREEGLRRGLDWAPSTEERRPSTLPPAPAPVESTPTLTVARELAPEPVHAVSAEKPNRPEPVTLVASPDALARSMTVARARHLIPAILCLVAFGLVFTFFTPHREVRVFGFVVHALLAFELVTLAALMRDDSPQTLRRFNIGMVLVFSTTPLSLYFFSPFGETSTAAALGIMLFSFGAPAEYAAAAIIAVAAGHSLVFGGILLGWLRNRGYFEVSASPNALVANLFHALTMYASSFVLGGVFRRRMRQTFARQSEAFRQLAEREALLNDARAELENALGVGQPGRLTGQRLGRFQLGTVLGRGGMGEVYEATDVVTGASAAVKVIGRAGNRDAVQRFIREARTIAALSSDHIVAVCEVADESAALPFIAMERLIGADLSSILQRQLFIPPAEVAQMIDEIAEGLDVAHAAGVIHSDVKPQNIFRTHGGTWKLLDFGVASTREHEGGDPLLGTPAFMAPEQLTTDGPPIGPQTDVHALGAVAYRCLTGRPAFSARDVAKVIYRVLRTMPDRPTSVVDVPRAVDDVIAQALAKEPAARFATVGEFAVAFRQALGLGPRLGD